MTNYDSVEAGILMEGMTSEQKLYFHREMSDAWRDPKKAARLKRWLGGIGAHHFYLGDQNRGVKSLLFFWTTIPVIMSLFEGSIKKRTQRVNSDIAMRLMMRIKGGGATAPSLLISIRHQPFMPLPFLRANSHKCHRSRMRQRPIQTQCPLQQRDHPVRDDGS